jgi:hypothetical protein
VDVTVIIVLEEDIYYKTQLNLDWYSRTLPILSIATQGEMTKIGAVVMANANALTEMAELFFLEPDGGNKGGEDMILHDSGSLVL